MKLSLPVCLLALVFLPSLSAEAGPASARASVSAVILPARTLEGEIGVTPKHISLVQGGHGKFTIVNHSGEIHDIHVEVEPTIYGVCRLAYTPKRVVLADGEFQVFRLFYVTENNRKCNTTFRIRLFYNDYGNSDSVDVDCD